MNNKRDEYIEASDAPLTAAEAEEITAAPEVEPEGKIIDLMEALKASLRERAEHKGQEGYQP